MKYKVKIKNITPYMQHRMDDKRLKETEKKRGFIIERPEVSQEDAIRAEHHCYRNATGDCYIPAEQIRMSLIAAGGYLKGKVGVRTKSMKSVFAAMLRIDRDEIVIPNYDDIDIRSAVNKNVKARVIVIRPKWTEWEAEFTILLDNETITVETLVDLVKTAGTYVGIGSYRPTNNGYFGRFELVSLEKVA